MGEGRQAPKPPNELYRDRGRSKTGSKSPAVAEVAEMGTSLTPYRWSSTMSYSFRRFALALVAGAAAAVTTLVGAAPAAAADRVGIRQLSIPVADRGGPVEAFVWYPADDGGSRETIGETLGFFGSEAWRDAPIATGKHPLIVISHGSGGNVAGFGPGLGWLTTRLAAAGYIVVGPNHPGTMTGDSDQKKTVELWHRPLDLSATVDTMLADPAFAPKIAADRIGALGFSLGGYDVLALAGAEQRRKPFAEFCYRDAAQSHGFCDWLKRGGVDLTALDPRMEANHRDPRFKAIVAVDPAFTQSYDETSLKGISVPVQFLNLGTRATTPSLSRRKSMIR